MRPLLLVLLLVGAAVPSHASVLFVDLDASGTGTGASWTDAFTDLRDALAVAVSGDEIWVAEGEYGHAVTKDVRAVFEVPSGVSVYGGFVGNESSVESRVLDEHATVLTGAILDSVGFEDIAPRVVAVVDTEDEVLLDRLTVFGATVYDAGSEIDGRAGGLLAERSSVRVQRVVFLDCGATPRAPFVTLGGGVALVDCPSAEFEDVSFIRCEATAGGGSLGSVGTTVLVDRGQFGASAPRKSDASRIQWNVGGVYGDDSSRLVIRNSIFERCSGDDFGALRGTVDLENVVVRDCYSDNVGAPGLLGTGVLTNVLFVHNEADVGPGAVRGGGEFRNVSFVGNVDLNASFGVLHATEPIRLEHCTFVGNSGSFTDRGATFSGDFTAEICNTIFWGNWSRTPDDIISPYEIDGATVSVSNSIVQGSGGSGVLWDSSLGIDLGGNLDVDPRFVDLADLDVRLTLGSPAIDTGRADCLSDPALDVDLDGNPRLAGVEVDMGAYEFQGPFCQPFEVVFGASWDGISLQQILDTEYGVGVIDVATDYEGARCGDAETPYWLDDSVDGWIVREVADFAPTNVLGWYAEELTGAPSIDGIDDGVIFDGSAGEGGTAFVGLTGPTRFGLYLNPNGAGDGTNAPEPEAFFTNRFYNDEGVDGSGVVHAPESGDPQALIFNITHLRNGVPTYVVAWEDIDSGSPLAPSYEAGFTDNDFNDLVVEIRANSPVSIDDDVDRDEGPQVVTGLSLRVAPNPFNPSTNVLFSVPANEHARVAVYDVRGREVDVLFQGFGTGEERALAWSPTAIGSGIYFVRLETTSRVVTEKVTVLK